MCKLAQPFWRVIWQYLKKLYSVYTLSSNLGILTHLRNYICTRIFIFVIRNPPKIISSAHWLSKLLIHLYNGLVSNLLFKKRMRMVFMNCRYFQMKLFRKMSKIETETWIVGTYWQLSEERVLGNWMKEGEAMSPRTYMHNP